MTLDQTLRHYRKELGFSQEKLAEKLHVSRQAITKWETGGGLPDISNLQAIAQLFQISLDDLLAESASPIEPKDFLYQSYTSYDIERPKHFDLNLASSQTIYLQARANEKIQIRLASNSIKNLEQACKIKLDDSRDLLDLQLRTSADLSESTCKEDLMIFLTLPKNYLRDVDVKANCQSLNLLDLDLDNLELDGRASEVSLTDCQGHIELNNKLDCQIKLNSFSGRLDLNQISCSSKVYLPKDFDFVARKKGLTTKLAFEKAGQPTNDFSNPEADNTIELNGIKSELTVIQE